jgi:hypothetical protein
VAAKTLKAAVNVRMTNEIMNALILYSGELPAISISADAIALKDGALSSSALVAKVSNESEQAVAVAAQIELKKVATLFEDARVEITAPLLKAQREIKAKVDVHKAELTEELNRVSRLVGDFQQLELAKIRAAEAAKQAELTRIEQEREAALAKANSFEERAAIQERAEMKVAEAQQPVFVPAARAAGQRVSEEWEIESVDVHRLYKSYPNCLDLKPRLSEIKILLNQGITLPGVKATKGIKAGIRLSA